MSNEQGRGHRSQRCQMVFWQKLGITDVKEAEYAALCFPEAWVRPGKYAYGVSPRGATKEENAARCAGEFCRLLATDPRHPAFWYAQGCDFDEMAHRAVAALAMVKLGQEETPPAAAYEHHISQAMLAEVVEGGVLPGVPENQLPQYSPPPDRDTALRWAREISERLGGGGKVESKKDWLEIKTGVLKDSETYHELTRAFHKCSALYETQPDHWVYSKIIIPWRAPKEAWLAILSVPRTTEPKAEPAPEEAVETPATRPGPGKVDRGTVDLAAMPEFEITPYEKRGRKSRPRRAKKRQK